MSTRRERERRKKLKRIRNAISAAFCVLVLLLVLGIVNLLTGVLEKHLPIIDGNGDYTISILEKLSGDKKEKEPDKKGLTVCIDAGHGGKDNGSDYKNRYEKDDTLAMALAVQSYLQEKDVNVIMTRSDDTFLKLSERCDIANEAEADYYVSLHRNTGEGYGVETWVYSGANEETMGLAGNIQQGLAGVGVQRDRDVKKGTQKSSSKDYYVNSHSHMPSCIIEMGFMNNAKDNQLLMIIRKHMRRLLEMPLLLLIRLTMVTEQVEIQKQIRPSEILQQVIQTQMEPPAAQKTVLPQKIRKTLEKLLPTSRFPMWKLWMEPVRTGGRA